MCDGGPIVVPGHALPQGFRADDFVAAGLRPGKIIRVGATEQFSPMPMRQKPVHNCRNCGAPPESVCSYCGTEAT